MSRARRQFLVVVCGLMVAAFGMLSGFAGVAEAGKGSSKTNEVRVEGRATAVDATIRVVVIRKSNGQSQSLSVPTTAKVERNGVSAPLSAFKVGDFVQARLTNNIITKIEARGL